MVVKLYCQSTSHTRRFLQPLLLLTFAWFATATFGGWTNRWSTSYGGERPGGASDIAESATMGSGGHVLVGGRSRSTVGSETTETLVVKVDPVGGRPLWEFRSSSVGIENATVSRIETVDRGEVLVALGWHLSNRRDFNRVSVAIMHDRNDDLLWLLHPTRPQVQFCREKGWTHWRLNLVLHGLFPRGPVPKCHTYGTGVGRFRKCWAIHLGNCRRLCQLRGKIERS